MVTLFVCALCVGLIGTQLTQRQNAPPSSPISGAPERIATLRYRHQKVLDSISSLEDRVNRQSAELEQINSASHSSKYDVPEFTESQEQQGNITIDDLEREMEEIRNLEMRKQKLEERVSGMERDLGGLLR